ncbi:Hypothetical predicted protein [Scomber scombrus]|uniref:Uncharacterized protein n=1 Tax=Scomber scombrus TaxID=13677 RepID=A0AAV1PT33_SCOSC
MRSIRNILIRKKPPKQQGCRGNNFHTEEKLLSNNYIQRKKRTNTKRKRDRFNAASCYSLTDCRKAAFIINMSSINIKTVPHYDVDTSGVTQTKTRKERKGRPQSSTTLLTNRIPMSFLKTQDWSITQRQYIVESYRGFSRCVITASSNRKSPYWRYWRYWSRR